jgi:GNAT superfamily N-acetyltransferase
MGDIALLRLEVTSDKAKIDFDRVYAFLNGQSHWAEGIPRDLFVRAMLNAECFAGFLAGEQIAFARVVTDKATFANLMDVFVEPQYRGMGHATALLTEVFKHPDLQGLRRFTLATKDKHGLYAKFGFHAPLLPETLMERYHPDIYTSV